MDDKVTNKKNIQNEPINTNNIQDNNVQNNNIVNNNQISNNQSKNNTGLIIIIIILLTIIIGGVIYYFFIRKTDNGSSTPTPIVTPTPTPSVTPTPEPTPNANAKDKFISNKTYKSKDSKTTLTINEIEPLNEGYTHIHATYKGKKYTFNLFDSSITNDEYLSIDGDPDDGDVGQCSSMSLLLNLNTKSIEREVTGYISYKKTAKGYFFYESYCLGGYDRVAYDSNWKELGRLIYIDPQGYVYVLNNKKIIQYDIEGNKINENTTDAIYTGPGIVYNKTLYYVGDDKNGRYLYNNATNKKTQILNTTPGYDPYTGLDAEVKVELKLNNNKIEIKEWTETKYIFDPSTNELTEINK